MWEGVIDKRQTPLVHPEWDYSEFHREVWNKNNITVVICERDTKDITKLCLESLLHYYPDIPILIVDGGSTDGTVLYIDYKAIIIPNIKVWHRVGRNGHGTMLDDAIRKYIKTKYVLLLDSDVIVKRGGWIEHILTEMSTYNIYAMGTLMRASYSNEGCGDPKDEADIMRYAHPSCSIINRNIYLTMAPFVEHGAPLCFNMKEARDRKLRVEYFPIEYYVAHLSGASWCIPRVVWRDDKDIIIRPFITFIIDSPLYIDLLKEVNDKDFEIIIPTKIAKENIVYHPDNYFNTNNDVYYLRFSVHGEYICRLKKGIDKVDNNFIEIVKETIIKADAPNEISIGGLVFIKRKIWQSTDAVL